MLNAQSSGRTFQTSAMARHSWHRAALRRRSIPPRPVALVQFGVNGPANACRIMRNDAHAPEFAAGGITVWAMTWTFAVFNLCVRFGQEVRGVAPG